jgi:hypothetical protein
MVEDPPRRPPEREAYHNTPPLRRGRDRRRAKGAERLQPTEKEPTRDGPPASRGRRGKEPRRNLDPNPPGERSLFMSTMAQHGVEPSAVTGIPPAPAESPAPTAPIAGPVPVVRSLDDLARMNPTELAALYRGAVTPAVPALDGHLVGRMLAIPVLPAWLGGVLRRFAAWRHFPWRGKSFTTLGETRGEGINRVFGDRQPRRWFRFETFVAPSRAGSFDAFQLDYDNRDNPALIRAIKDEVRQVAPGLFLGLAYFVWRKKPRLVLYFGLARR